MNNEFNSTQKIAEIAVVFPKAMEIFKVYGIDFCCGGNRPLAEAIKEKNLNETEILNKLNEEFHKSEEVKLEQRDWRTEKYSVVIDYVINTHHVYTSKVLPEIAELTTKILRAHGEHHGEELTKVHKLFNALKTELEGHLIKEEEIVFPLIKKYEENGSKETLKMALDKIKELEAEHEGAGDILKELRKITSEYSVPEDGCNTYRYTYSKLIELEGDLFKHIHIENNILFPRLTKELGA
ncbi:MAG: iron-sulfur cluster repair di-iron protein [Clostridiaceae bacterium]|nr:iron-sulfur cluster repair di-iron protein [Clostridiaceae bacterium]